MWIKFIIYFLATKSKYSWIISTTSSPIFSTRKLNKQAGGRSKDLNVHYLFTNNFKFPYCRYHTQRAKRLMVSIILESGFARYFQFAFVVLFTWCILVKEVERHYSLFSLRMNTKNSDIYGRLCFATKCSIWYGYMHFKITRSENNKKRSAWSSRTPYVHVLLRTLWY